MKYLKLFEDINRMYKKGDYAIVTFRRGENVYEDVIVQLKKIIITGPNRGFIRVNKLDDTTEPGRIYLVGSHQVKCWSENKEELETILTSKKFNL